MLRCSACLSCVGDVQTVDVESSVEYCVQKGIKTAGAPVDLCEHFSTC